MKRKTHFIGTREIAEFAGVSERQVQWWGERGILGAKHEKHRRQWPLRAAARAILIRDLRARNVVLKTVRRILALVERSATPPRFLCLIRGKISPIEDAKAALQEAVGARGPVQIVEVWLVRVEDVIAFKQRRGTEKRRRFYAAGAA